MRLARQMGELSGTTLIVLGHGAKGTPGGAETIIAHCDQLRALGSFDRVEPAFLRQPPFASDVLAGLDTTDIVIVPHFASDGFMVTEVAPRELGLDGPITSRHGQQIHITNAVGTHPEFKGIAASAVQFGATQLGASMSETGVLVVGHGTPRNPRSELDTKDLAEKIGATTGAAQSVALFLEIDPLLDIWRERLSTKYVVVLPYLFAAGFHGTEDVPTRLSHKPDDAAVHICPPIGSHPDMVKIIQDRALHALQLPSTASA